MFRKKGCLTTAIVSFVLLWGVMSVSYSDSGAVPASMQRHIEEVRRTNPAEYQAMMDKAGGIIKNCLSCHDEDFGGSGKVYDGN